MDVARPVIEQSPFARIYFVGFILITSLTALNQFIGIIVTTMQESVHADDARQRADIEAPAPAEHREMLQRMQQMHARLEALEQRERSSVLSRRPRRARNGSAAASARRRRRVRRLPVSTRKCSRSNHRLGR